VTRAQEQLKTDPPYSPLSPLEVEALGAPPPQEPDAYLRARIDRFYAELQVGWILLSPRCQTFLIAAARKCLGRAQPQCG